MDNIEKDNKIDEKDKIEKKEEKSLDKEDNKKEKEFLKEDVENLEERDIEEHLSDTQLIKKEDILPFQIPLIPLDGRPVIPGMVLPVFVKYDPKVEKLLNDQKDKENSYVGFVYLKEKLSEEKTHSQLSFADIGVVAKINKLLQIPTGDFHLLIQGLKRFKIEKIIQTEPYPVANVSYPPTDYSGDEKEIKAYTLNIAAGLREISQVAVGFPEELKFILSNISVSDPNKLCDFTLLITEASPKEVQEILEIFNIRERLEKTLLLLKKELELIKLREKINKQIEEKISQRQREFFLKEQLKAIKKELGYEQDEKSAEINRLKKEFEKKNPSKEAKEKFEEELNKLSLLEIHSPEFGVTRNYLDWLVSLPWGNQTQDNLDLKSARKVLDEDHYGLDDVKDRLIEFLAVGKLLERVEGSILCFVGPPGVGKTSLGKSIARALGRKFFRFSVGGMRDEAEIKGHRRTYIGALPGKIIQALKTVGTDNPVIMLDEIDKLGKDYRGDPSSALLEVLDPEQNTTFRDHYLEIPYDLSKICFIATANIIDTIPLPLQDRMEIIRLPGYIKEEKIEIAKRHLIPKLLKKHGLKEENITFEKEALEQIIELYARESGVRGLEKQLSKIMRKVAVKVVKDEKSKNVITSEEVDKYLGAPIYVESPLSKRNAPGVVTGLAWTPLGGSVLYIESISKPAKSPGFKQTGQLGDVMVESSNIAYSYVSSNTKLFGIKKDFFDKVQIHLHVPAGATPKDGPSAGITMATSLISLALGEKVPVDIAMTGELTLTGRVLPVGGIREKLIAAKRAKIYNVILPSENKRDIKEIPSYVIEGLKIHYVEEYPQVYEICFKDKK